LYAVREAEHLDWLTRLRIIMGVTYCLEHMNQLHPPFAPRTLNSSSIYLTEDYAAKISDTEFWKNDKDAASTQTTDQDSIVYKFGILLLEVISGRLPFSEDHGLLVLWASSYLDGKRPLSAMPDPMLRASSSVPDEDLAALCDVVRLCINRDAEKRPSMNEVASMMKGIIRLSPEQTTPRNNPLWWAELEIISTEST
jgi:serine/threonine protein kinase